MVLFWLFFGLASVGMVLFSLWLAVIKDKLWFLCSVFVFFCVAGFSFSTSSEMYSCNKFRNETQHETRFDTFRSNCYVEVEGYWFEKDDVTVITVKPEHRPEPIIYIEE